MTRSAEITLLFYDAEYPFRLGVGELRQLQEKCGERGPQRLLRDLSLGEWHVDDVIQPIRIGLIGGGMKPEDAAKLVNARTEDQPLSGLVLFAVAVLQAAIVGVPSDPIPERKGDNPGEAPGATATASASPSSTATGQPSDGPPDRSIN